MALSCYNLISPDCDLPSIYHELQTLVVTGRLTFPSASLFSPLKPTITNLEGSTFLFSTPIFLRVAAKIIFVKHPVSTSSLLTSKFLIIAVMTRASPCGDLTCTASCSVNVICQDKVLSLDVKAAENSATIAKDKTNIAVEGGATRGWSSAQGDLQYNLKVLEGIGGNGADAAATDQQQLIELADSAGKTGGMRDLFSAELDIQRVNEVSQGDMEEAHVKGSVLA